MNALAGGGVGTDAFPTPTHDRYDRGANVTALRPYHHPNYPEYDGAPQEQFLAGPPGNAAIESDARNHAFVSGLGAGKTAAGILRVVANAEQWNPGELGMIVAPTVPSLKNAILPTMREFGLLDAWDYHGKGAEEPGIHTPSGSRIILESADNTRKIERLRGPNLAWIWMDEAASIAERAWEILQGRLRVGDYRNAFITTTPKGKNWVYDRFREETTDDINGVFGVPSWANPHNPDDYIERLETEYEGSFYEQEVEGAFTQFEGLVYPWFDPADHLLDDVPPASQFDRIIYGVDWGFNSPSVILAIGVEGDRRVILEEFYERRCTVTDLVRIAKDMQDRWAPGTFYCDPAQPENIEELDREGIDARQAENAVMPGIQHVAGEQDHLRVAPGCQNIINEFGQYQYKDGDEQDNPISKNDHALDALRYALFTFATNGPTEPFHFSYS